MNILEAFGGIFATIWEIFVNIWEVITSPSAMVVLACIVMATGFFMFVGGLVVPHYGRKEMWQRLSFIFGGPLIFITGVAIAIWAGTSSSDGFTWN